MYKKIAELCASKGITVSKLEEILGFGKATISKWKESSPSVRNLKLVADYFHVSVDYLLSNENKKEET